MALPIVPWIGGKRRLADTLIGRFPPHTCYVELFAGGAALYFMRAPAECEVLNDEESLSAAHLRLTNAYIERLDWLACIDRYDRPHTLFYADPPYWQTEGYGVPFGWDQYEALAARLATLKGKAVVSLNDHPDIRRAFSAYEMEDFEIDYTVGGGGKPATRRELIIYSWDRQTEPAGLF